MSNQSAENEFTFKDYFVPLTTIKAIHWIVIIGFLVYGNMLFNGFVWDDKTYILNNVQIQTFDVLHSFGNNLFNNSGFYRPIPALYFTILFKLFAYNAFFYHFTQLLLHITVVNLLYILFTKFFSRVLSLLFAIIFLVHPIQVESVAFIAASQSELCFLFGILALLINQKKVLRTKQIIVMFLLLFLSLLVKEVGLIFLLMIFIDRFLYKKHISTYFYIGAALTVIMYLLLRFYVGNVSFDHPKFLPVQQLSLSERILLIPAIVQYYLQTFIYPGLLVIDQLWTRQSLTFYTFAIPLAVMTLFIAVIVSGASLFFRYKKEQYLHAYLFFTLWFFLSMVPLLHIIPLDMTVAERWFYFPIAGLLGFIGIVTQYVIQHNKTLKTPVILLLCCVIVIFSVRTIVRNTNWKDPVTLYSHDIQREDNFNLHYLLASEHIKSGNFKLAQGHLKRSVEQFPNEVNISALGFVYQSLNDVKLAEKYYLKSLTMDSSKILPYGYKHFESSYIGYAQYLIRYDDPMKAVLFLNTALQEYDNSHTLWLYLAFAEYKSGNKQKSLQAAKEAYTLLPNAANQYAYSQLLNNKPIIIP